MERSSRGRTNYLLSRIILEPDQGVKHGVYDVGPMTGMGHNSADCRYDWNLMILRRVNTLIHSHSIRWSSTKIQMHFAED